MAQFQHLPIYKQTYDILLRTMTATKEFPREYKYTLGQKIKDDRTKKPGRSNFQELDLCPAFPALARRSRSWSHRYSKRNSAHCH